jgi:hypothetical protein
MTKIILSEPLLHFSYLKGQSSYRRMHDEFTAQKGDPGIVAKRAASSSVNYYY